jgi:hypothetical protein
MALLRNAFRYRLADRPTLDTSLFLHLYCPTLLQKLQPEDFTIPKLVVFSGSPGSGKSSFLRLFQMDSLIALRRSKSSISDDVIGQPLHELGVFSEDGIRFVGLYIQCDSNLRLLGDVQGIRNNRLLNALFDVRTTLAYLRALRQLVKARLIDSDLDGMRLRPLPPEEGPAPLFARESSFIELELECTRIETDFATLLNSFPDDPVSPNIVPHSRVFSLSYLAHQLQFQGTSWPSPVLLLDDFQDLYEEQRTHLRGELLRRVAVPRWIAVRKYVYELEDLLPLEGTKEGRDVREIDLDAASPKTFRKFLENVTERRLRSTEALQHLLTIQSFREHLLEPTESLPWTRVGAPSTRIIERLKELGADEQLAISEVNDVPIDLLYDLEKHAILAERKANRKQRYILPELEPPEPSDNKTEEAARLFLSQRYDLPYYYGFDALSVAATRNVEQFLDLAADYAEKMIFRSELNRSVDLSAKEQHDLLRASARKFYLRIDQSFPHGYSIRQFIENLGRFCQAVTNRPNAPIAPGVTGFGLTRVQLQDARVMDSPGTGMRAFRETIASAVAGNVLWIKKSKQGQPGAQKFVFYLNRLLCIHFSLPLGYGGWQPLSLDTIVKMISGPVAAEEMGRKWQTQQIEFEDGE